jgi:glutamate racemase
VIEEEVRERIGDEVSVVDSARATAAEVRAFLESRGLAREGGGPGATRLLVTDVPRTFQEVASRFLGSEVGEVEQVDL